MIQNFQVISDLFSAVSKFQQHIKLCSNCSLLLTPVWWREESCRVLLLASSSTMIQNFQVISDLFSAVCKFQQHTKLCSNCSLLLTPVWWREESCRVLLLAWPFWCSVCVPSECLYSSLSCPARKSRIFGAVLNCHLWPVYLYLFFFFLHYLINGKIFERGGLPNIKCVSIFCRNFLWNFFFEEELTIYYHNCT